MCGRFSQVIGVDILLDRFNIQELEANVTNRYNVAPMTLVPIVIEENKIRILRDMQWGFLPFWAKTKKGVNRPINAKIETVAQKGMFRDSFTKHRCIIPITGFYEWRKLETRKQPYYIKLKSNEIIALAGIFSTWYHDDTLIRSFAILTTEPNDLISPIHNRMPVILNNENEAMWLSSQTDRNRLSEVCVPYASDNMELFLVDSYVNSPSNDSKECIVPLENQSIPEDNQQDLEDFF
ncbi:MAG: SOS response-associated peptidase [Candidatus Kariarchaeaceae archaeon]|jgi:putative SOS response-associated peptidase YedK